MMPEGRRIGLDNPAFSGRVRTHDRSVRYSHRPVHPPVRRAIDGFSLANSPNYSAPPIHKPTTQTVVVPEKKSVSNKIAVPIATRKVDNPKPALPRQSRSVVLARQMVQKKSAKRIPHVPQHSRVSILLVLMAVLIFSGGSFVTYLGWRTNKKAAAQVEVLSKTTEDENDGDVPAEDDISPDIISAYRVAPDLPRLIKIPRLQINARVKRLGVKTSGELMAPSNVHDAGWYDGSAKPGESGAVLIDGHVHGPTKPGVFYRLPNLVAGDTVEIERGDGKLISYKVIKTESVDQGKVDMAKALTSVEPGKPGLNIITCTGRYDVRTNKYEQRLIVYTIQQ